MRINKLPKEHYTALSKAWCDYKNRIQPSDFPWCDNDFKKCWGECEFNELKDFETVYCKPGALGVQSNIKKVVDNIKIRLPGALD